MLVLTHFAEEEVIERILCYLGLGERGWRSVGRPSFGPHPPKNDFLSELKSLHDLIEERLPAGLRKQNLLRLNRSTNKVP